MEMKELPAHAGHRGDFAFQLMAHPRPQSEPNDEALDDELADGTHVLPLLFQLRNIQPAAQSLGTQYTIRISALT